jgi:tRNA(fMet)-specific endonuclease VapC
MNLLFDSNIILTIIRASDYAGLLQFLNPHNAPVFASVASEAEIKSIAVQNNWGINRRNRLNDFLDQTNIIEINQFNITGYIEIDSYSQRRNPAYPDYPFDTPGNMGKNDLWIASLAALLGLQLVTTDPYFDHLHQVFFVVRKIAPTAFDRFFN